jgi:hypothetical protein
MPEPPDTCGGGWYRGGATPGSVALLLYDCCFLFDMIRTLAMSTDDSASKFHFTALN